MLKAVNFIRILSLSLFISATNASASGHVALEDGETSRSKFKQAKAKARKLFKRKSYDLQKNGSDALPLVGPPVANLTKDEVREKSGTWRGKAKKLLKVGRVHETCTPRAYASLSDMQGALWRSKDVCYPKDYDKMLAAACSAHCNVDRECFHGCSQVCQEYLNKASLGKISKKDRVTLAGIKQCMKQDEIPSEEGLEDVSLKLNSALKLLPNASRKEAQRAIDFAQKQGETIGKEIIPLCMAIRTIDKERTVLNKSDWAEESFYGDGRADQTVQATLTFAEQKIQEALGLRMGADFSAMNLQSIAELCDALGDEQISQAAKGILKAQGIEDIYEEIGGTSDSNSVSAQHDEE